MKHNAHHPDHKRRNDSDDLWTWLVIVAIFLTATLALYVPLIWSSMYHV